MKLCVGVIIIKVTQEYDFMKGYCHIDYSELITKSYSFHSLNDPEFQDHLTTCKGANL